MPERKKIQTRLRIKLLIDGGVKNQKIAETVGCGVSTVNTVQKMIKDGVFYDLLIKLYKRQKSREDLTYHLNNYQNYHSHCSPREYAKEHKLPYHQFKKVLSL